jgi:hypothetical protein
LPNPIFWCVLFFTLPPNVSRPHQFSVIGEELPLTLLHKQLQMQGLLPLAEGYSPRVYIYSDADQTVPFTSVEGHLATLRANASFDVVAEQFDGSQHVQHERHDPERYWKAVQAVWERSLPTKAKL